MAIPVKHKFVAYRGITFSENVYLQDGLEEPLDLTGYVGRMYVAPDFGDTPVATVSCTINRAMVTLELTSTETSALDPGIYKYDMEIESPSGRVFQLLYGGFTVKDAITE